VEVCFLFLSFAFDLERRRKRKEKREGSLWGKKGERSRKDGW
jgi:hypothetical protein